MSIVDTSIIIIDRETIIDRDTNDCFQQISDKMKFEVTELFYCLIIYIEEIDNIVKYIDENRLIKYISDNAQKIISYILIEETFSRSSPNTYSVKTAYCFSDEEESSSVEILLQYVMVSFDNIYIETDNEIMYNTLNTLGYGLHSIELDKDNIISTFSNNENKADNELTYKILLYNQETLNNIYSMNVLISDELWNYVMDFSCETVKTNNIVIMNCYLNDYGCIVGIENTLSYIHSSSILSLRQIAPFLLVFDDDDHFIHMIYIMIKYYKTLCGIFHVSNGVVNFYQINHFLRKTFLDYGNKYFIDNKIIELMRSEGIISHIDHSNNDQEYFLSSLMEQGSDQLVDGKELHSSSDIIAVNLVSLSQQDITISIL